MKKPKAPKDEPMWDQLREMGELMDSLITTTVQRVVPFLQNKELNCALNPEQGQTLLSWAKIYQRDIHEYQTALNEIHAERGNKKGAPSAEEYYRCFQIYEKYMGWQDRFNSTVIPTIDSILNLYVIAEENLEKAKAADTTQQETPDVP